MLAPARVSVPVPALIRPRVPAISELIVAVLPVPRGLTVMVGAAPARVSLLPYKVHPAAEEVSVSPKVSAVRVRAPSRRIVLSAARLSVLKSAVEPVASATVPALQLPVALQLPPVTSWV